MTVPATEAVRPPPEDWLERRNRAGGGPAPPRLDFEVPVELAADRPPEARGLARDEVRLMIVSRADGRIEHVRFRDLPSFLRPGDLLIFNNSATLPAAVPAQLPGGTRVELRFSTPVPADLRSSGVRRPMMGRHAAVDREGALWVVELRSADGGEPFGDARGGELLTLGAAARVELLARYLASPRLWLARFIGEPEPIVYLARHGHPIRYAYVSGEWPLSAYQTAFALEPGSAEMPSAARPFTPELIARLISRGVQLAPITLHTGVSSPEHDEPPYPESFAVPAHTVRLVNATRGWGGRVIAIGTTAVRALESVVSPDGHMSPGEGWTDLLVTPERGLRAIDGLITGWHEPRSSHLALLEAAAGRPLLERSYERALAHGYLWHELGDSHLILP